MHGEKWHLFLLQLSFIGWYLLCLPTFGLGILFLTPYYMATMAESMPPCAARHSPTA